MKPLSLFNQNRIEFSPGKFFFKAFIPISTSVEGPSRMETMYSLFPRLPT